MTRRDGLVALGALVTAGAVVAGCISVLIDIWKGHPA